MDDRPLLEDSEKLSRNLKLILAYDGSDFAGWQVQPGRSTIQGVLASAIGRLTGENVLPQGSGRTDAGVHAFGQVATFQTASRVPTENWVKALNDLLPPSIRALDVAEAAIDFHARKSARAKTYTYRIYRGAVCPPFIARYVWHYPFPLDELRMAQAAPILEGEHDFSSFAAVDPERVERMASGGMAGGAAGGSEGEARAGSATPANFPTTNVRTIFSSAWAREGEELLYTVRGRGFLHHMVRNLVGTMMLIGKGLTDEDFGAILAARNRSAAGPTAPASGLYLVNVEYPPVGT